MSPQSPKILLNNCTLPTKLRFDARLLFIRLRLGSEVAQRRSTTSKLNPCGHDWHNFVAILKKFGKAQDKQSVVMEKGLYAGQVSGTVKKVTLLVS